MSEAFQKFLNLSHSENADERAEAARELKHHLRNEPASHALADLLGDSDWRVRRAAVDSFLEMRAYNAIPLMLNALYSEDNAGKRNAAIDILTRFGKEILPYLQPHLASDNVDVQMFLINILGDLRDDTFVDYITKALEHEDMNIVSSAILALGKIGHESSLPYLKKFLHAEDVWLTFQAIEAAGEMQDPALIAELIELYNSSFYRKAILKALGKFHHPEAYGALAQFVKEDGKLNIDAVQALIDLYETTEPAELKQEQQRKLREVFRNNLSADAVDLLIRYYQESSDPPARKNILQLLGWTKSSAAIRVLINALHQDDLIELAAASLVRGEKEASSQLMARLQEDIDEDQILITLGILNEMPRVYDAISFSKLMSNSSTEIRYNVYKLLSRNPSINAEDLLIRGVLDPSDAVNQICRETLLSRCRESKTVCQHTIETLKPYSQSSDPVERANAIEFLTLLEGENRFPLLFQALKDEAAIVRQKAVSLLGTGYNDQFQRPLIGALADEDPKVRELAARALGAYRSNETLEALLSAIRDEVIWVRIAAYDSLAGFSDTETIAQAFLQQIEIENPIARATILKSLGGFRTPASKEVLLKHLNSEDPEIRKNACESLGEFNDNDVVFHLFTLLQNDADWRVRVATIHALSNIKPFRLQEALLERLRADEDPFVRKEILKTVHKLGLDYLPPEVFHFLQDRNLADSTYDFLLSNKTKFFKQIQEAAKSQPPTIRRILKTIIA